jgi:type IV secretory pathway VirB10-like protein
MKNQKLNHIILWAIAIILGFAMNSCSAKKTDKTKTSEEIKTEIVAETDIKKSEESNVKKTENTIVDDKNETITKETIYEPIDHNKPASVIDPDGRKTSLNNSKKTTRETTKKNNTKTGIAKASNANSKSEASTKSKSGSKSKAKKAAEAINTNRKAWSSLNMLWLLIPLGLILAFLNKNKITTWAKNIWWI